MSAQRPFVTFCEDGVSFHSRRAASMRTLYFPLAGADAASMKSAVTPFLSGDIKVDKSKYITKPMSREDLRNSVRNFFVRTRGGEVFSLTERESEDAAEVTIGQLWQTLTNTSARLGIELESTHFVPVTGETVEVMCVKVTNTSRKRQRVVPMAVVPIFGRSLVNKHDHEHVTSLLHRVRQVPEGVVVAPTMAFNEEGHQEIGTVYFVLGAEGNGAVPAGSFPTVDQFLGDGSTLEAPAAVVSGEPRRYPRSETDGREAVGALVFGEVDLAPGETRVYIVVIGVAESEEAGRAAYARFSNAARCEAAFDEVKTFWAGKSGAIAVSTADPEFDAWMRWVTIQPVLRRIFGCSFLPDHDYGKGGKGWRDLWQDLLSLILIEPETVRGTLVDHIGGVRIDGSHATIIGTGRGEFIADRNAITRVWMDHGAWPWLTLSLYMEQTGDLDILWTTNSYFRDVQLSRAQRKDAGWSLTEGTRLCDRAGRVYEGTVLEHILVEHLVQFFNVGEHNLIRLENADWNDGLDMAADRGESVAFSSFYAGNMRSIADTLEYLQQERGIEEIEILEEITLLMGAGDYDDPAAKRRRLYERYFPSVQPAVSGHKRRVPVSEIIADLRAKAAWLEGQIRRQEWITAEAGGKRYAWFNGYYDNRGERVEGQRGDRVRMTLTGQVFPIMHGVADTAAVAETVRSVDAFLKDPVHGGHRLNTDFGLRNYLDLGRAFSFAYGTKENGAVFSHMATMYAFALYQRGFVEAGYEAALALYRMAMNTEVSKIYPNIPEYFDAQGRGMYCYLTGSASWYALLVLTQMFGVRGQKGDLIISPKLRAAQFDPKTREARVRCLFAGRGLEVTIKNPRGLDYGGYKINDVTLNGRAVAAELSTDGAVIPRAWIAAEETCRIVVVLG